MKIFKKKRLFIYIVFIALTVLIIGFIIFGKLQKNILIGSWISEDNGRIYQFDENTVTLSYTDSDESILYGYILVDNKQLILQYGNSKSVYEIAIQNDKIAIYSDNFDSAEILKRVYD